MAILNDTNLDLTLYWIKFVKNQPSIKSRFWFLFVPDTPVPDITKTKEVTYEQYVRIVEVNIHYYKDWELFPFKTKPNIDKLIDELLTS